MQNRFTFTEDQVANWHIDERTKTIGRQGIEAARRTLASLNEGQLAAAA